MSQRVDQCLRIAQCVAKCHPAGNSVRAHRVVCCQMSTPPPLLPCQPAFRPEPAYCPVYRKLSTSRSFSACALPDLSPGITASTSSTLSAQVSTSAYSPHRVLSSDFSFISSTVSLSVSTSVSPVVSASTSDSVSASASTRGCAPPHVSPTDTQQVIECIPIS